MADTCRVCQEEECTTPPRVTPDVKRRPQVMITVHPDVPPVGVNSGGAIRD